MIKLKQLFNKYFVYKGVVIHQSDGVDNIIEFNGYRDLQRIKKHYLSSSDYTVYCDSDSDSFGSFISCFVCGVLCYFAGKFNL